MLSEVYFHPTDIHGHTLRLPSHRAIQWLRDPGFERERIRTMAQVIKPTDIVFDIGAEQGDMSALFASWVPDGGVVLVEPNPLVWPCIRATFEENDLADRVLSFWLGFMGAEMKPGDVGLVPDVIDPAAGFLHLAEDEGVTQTVDWLARTGVNRWPDVITVDVEGAELEVLKGAVLTLKQARPEVFVSVHPRFLAHHFGQRPADVLSFLEGYGYRCQLLAADHELHYWATPT